MNVISRTGFAKVVWERAFPYLAVLLISVFTLRILLSFHMDNLHDFVDVIEGVLAGTPRGLAFQNRLLGPNIVHLISGLGISMSGALQLFYAAALFAIFAASYFFLKRLNLRTDTSVLLVALFAFAICGLQFYWFHVWDLIDLFVFTVFGYLAVSGGRLKFFVLLFFVALLNRESALFIAVFMIVYAFLKDTDLRGMPMRGVDMTWLATGVFLAGAGAVYTYFIRIALFISLPDGGADDKAEFLGNEVHTIDNIHRFFLGNLSNPDVAITISIVTGIAYFTFVFRSLSQAAKSLYLTFLIVFLSILTFGIVVETRNFLILIPFFIFLFAAKIGGEVSPKPAGN